MSRIQIEDFRQIFLILYVLSDKLKDDQRPEMCVSQRMFQMIVRDPSSLRHKETENNKIKWHI